MGKKDRSKIKKVVLAYSGGLDTSVIIRWLKERYGCEVIAFCADLGQQEDMASIREKARKTGAAKVYTEDLREEFAKEYLFPMLRANAVYEGGYLLGTAIARPLIAKRQMEIVRREKADAVAHGATAKGNDQVRFELTCLSIDPRIRILAPWREWEFKSRGELIDYAKRFGIPVTATLEKPFSVDRNLFHTSHEGGILEDPWQEPPEEMFMASVSPEQAPDRPQLLEIDYVAGDPVSVDSKKMTAAKLIEHLNRIAGRHGIGRVDLVENRYVGIKSRGVYETPGGTMLHAAHRAIESITLDREVLHLRDSLVPYYASLIYNGYWFAPERVLLQKFFDTSQENVEGKVRLKLYKGNCTVIGRQSKKSLYRQDFATFETDQVYAPQEAQGFIHLNALRLKLLATLNKSKGR